MRKLFLLAAGFALTLATCQKDEGLVPDTAATSSFTVTIPQSEVQSRAVTDAFGTGTSVNRCILEIYRGGTLYSRIEKGVTGKQVTFGIRPEDVEFTHTSERGKTIDGHVSVVEPLGAETHVYIATSTARVIGKIDGTVIPAIDEKISLIPNMDKAKFFDVETELAIR